MKKKLVGLMFVTIGAMFTACASKEQKVETPEIDVQESEDIFNVVSEEEIYEGAWMSNPWVDSDQAGVLAATGFDLVAPSEASNVAYSYMPSTGMAQMNYTMKNAMWVYRMQPTDTFQDISGIYCEWNYTEAAKVAGMEAMEYSYVSEPDEDLINEKECIRVINWYDAQNKVTYSLSVLGIDLNGMDTVVFAEKLFILPSSEE